MIKYLKEWYLSTIKFPKGACETYFAMRVEYELSYVTCNQIDLMNIGMRLGKQLV